MKEAVILVADTHINSKTALCAPSIYDDDGNKHEQNKIQKWLWLKWKTCIKDIDELTSGYKRTVVFDGDIIELDAKNRSNQVISKNPSTILSTVDKTIQPLEALSDRMFVIRGTEAHVGKSGWIEDMMAEKYQAITDPETNRFSWWHLRAKFAGVKFDIAHHASMGTLPWTYANNVMKLVQLTRYHYLDWNEEPPDVVVRAHNHRFADSGETFSTRGVFLPCWQFHNSYLYRIGKENDRPHIGAVVFLCEDGKYEMKKLIYEPVRRKAWHDL